jgi:RNA polymerase sigma factor (sigma-70 family)
MQSIATTVSDAELVHRAAEGDDQAWNDLVRRKRDLVRSAARHVGLRSTDLADAEQMTWMRLMSNIGRLRNAGAINGWLVVTARREAIRFAVSAGKYHATDDATLRASRRDEACEGELPEHVVIVKERRASIRRAVQSLPDRQRAVLDVFLHETGDGYRSTAERWGIPIGAIGPTRRRALDRLRGHQELATLC